MHPRPITETSSPSRPSIRRFIGGPFGRSPAFHHGGGFGAPDGPPGARARACARFQGVSRVLLAALVALALAGAAVAVLRNDGGPAPAAAEPVIAGLYPDPSVIRAGDGYVLTATSRDW